MNKILKQVQSRKLKIEKLQSEIKELQSQCFHNNAEVVAHSDSGNWDGTSSYWVTVDCKDCLSPFSVYEDEDKNLYRQYLIKRNK